MTALPAKRFVILAVPRSGSNMLCTMLDSHPAILCHHEVFNPKGIRVALRLRGTDYSLGTMDERDGDPMSFLDRLWKHSLGFPCVGFKLTHRQNETVYFQLLADEAVAKVVLRRKNRLKTYVSWLISERLAEWEVYRDRDLEKDRPRVEVDFGCFRDRIAFDEAFYDEIRSTLERSRQTWVEVGYEELFRLEEQNRVLRFLGQEPATEPLEPRSVKQNSRSLRDLVANFAELENHLAGTEFEVELYSPEN